MADRNASNQKKIRILAVTAIFLAVFDVLIWHSVLVDDVLVPVVLESAGEPARIRMPGIAMDAAIEEMALAADGSMDAAGDPVAADPQAVVARPSETGNGAAAAPAMRERTGAPVRIKIPSIAVDAAIERVALAADGSMDVPKHPGNTAWFAPGPRPGDEGSAAIAGHVDSMSGAAAVFADLHKVRSGDTITVQDDKGAVTSFVVRASRRYDAAADATDVFTSNDGKAHLNMITCVGKWDKRTKQYAERLVVFADKVAQ